MTHERVFLGSLAAFLMLAVPACSGIDPDGLRTEIDIARREQLQPNDEVASLVQQWYVAHDYTLSWNTSSQAEAVLQSLTLHGLEPQWYGVATIASARAQAEQSRTSKIETTRALARLDVMVTAALLRAGRDVAIGRVRPETIEPHWKRARSVPDIATALETSRAENKLAGWLDTIAPRHHEYGELRRWLADLRQQPLDRSDPRLAQVAVNLDRVRWLPDDLGERHLLVNIPEFMLRAREHGRTALEMRVVVGKPGGQETPPISGELDSVVFNPYWNLPESIVLAETLPAMAKDPDYLERHGMEVLRTSAGSTRPIDPGDVDWEDPTTLRHVRIRQRPGTGNALGEIKFPFKNLQAIYLHDTPSTSLFARDVRAFSHGCVRVAEPVALARYLLSRDPDWTDERIARAIKSGDETNAGVTDTQPVHLVYFTVVSGPDGGPKFLKDVYGHDRRHVAAWQAGR